MTPDTRCPHPNRDGRRCRNRRSNCPAHGHLDPSEFAPDAPRDLVVIDRADVARRALPGGGLSREPVLPDPDAPARGPRVEPDPNRVFVYVCRCGVASRGRPVGDHACEPPAVAWDGADRRRLGLARQVDPARKPVLAAKAEPAPADAGPPTPPPAEIIGRKPRLVRSTGEAPIEPAREPERTNEPDVGWLES